MEENSFKCMVINKRELVYKDDDVPSSSCLSPVKGMVGDSPPGHTFKLPTRNVTL